MEPEAHRRDREQLLAEHEAVADRRRAHVDAAVAAAAEKRRAFFEWFESHLRIDAKGELDRERLLADMRSDSFRLAATAASRAAPEARVSREDDERDVTPPLTATG